MNKQELLEALKEGDIVGMFSHDAGGLWLAKKIDRVTNSLIIIGDKKFYRSDGRQRGGDDWHHYSIAPLDAEHFGKTVRELVSRDSQIIKRRQMESFLTKLDWADLSHEAITAIYTKAHDELGKK